MHIGKYVNMSRKKRKGGHEFAREGNIGEVRGRKVNRGKDMTAF